MTGRLSSALTLLVLCTGVVAGCADGVERESAPVPSSEAALDQALSEVRQRLGTPQALREEPVPDESISLYQGQVQEAVDLVLNDLRSAAGGVSSVGPFPRETVRSGQTGRRGLEQNRRPRALCADGTVSRSENDRGTCSWHRGVFHWF